MCVYVYIYMCVCMWVGSPPSFIVALVAKLESYIAVPKEMIIVEGDIGEEMYFINRVR